jgi:hypothetical protein
VGHAKLRCSRSVTASCSHTVDSRISQVQSRGLQRLHNTLIIFVAIAFVWDLRGGSSSLVCSEARPPL